MKRLILSFAFLSGSVLAACGAKGSRSSFDGELIDGSTEGTDDGSAPIFLGTTIDGGKTGCVNLQCKQHACNDGTTTSVSGTVFDPAGKVPLYNAIVYVPNSPLDPMKQGASCEQCGASVSGSPLVTTITDAAGRFTLKNVPAVDKLPIVIQVGKWRRILTVPTVNDCGDTVLPETETRLPRSKAEGDIPQIALSTGGCDPLECLLRKIGIDDTEFTGPDGNGRVHVFKGTSSPDPLFGSGIPGGQLPGGSPPSRTLWGSAKTLSRYDMVLMACECDEAPQEKPETALRAMYDYTSAGGRVFGSHYHYYWLEHGPEPFPETATWDHSLDVPIGFPATIDDSFPKGKAFKDWLVNVGGSPAPGGTLQINDAKGDVAKVTDSMSQRWIYLPSGTPSVQYFTFNTPITAPEDQKCGRVVYSDLHVAYGVNGDSAGDIFPNGCVTTDLSPQEKALEFMLFDLSSCVQSDDTPPAPPPVK